MALGTLDGTERNLAALNRANEIARREENLFFEAKSLACMGILFLGVGEYSKSVDVILQAQKIIPKIDDPQFLVGLCLRTASAALTALGEFSEAKRQIAQLIKHNLSLPGFAFTYVDFQLSSMIALVEGDWDEARRFAELRISDSPSAEEFGLEEQISYMTGTSETPISDFSRFITESSLFDLEEIGWNAPMLAFAGLVQGNMQAIDAAEKIVTAEPVDPNHNVHPVVIDAVRAIGAIACEDKNLAADLHHKFLPFRQTWSPGFRIFGIDRLLALTAITAEDPDMARKHFEESTAFCENAGMLPELAWTYHDYVVFLLSRDGRVDRSNLVQMLEAGLVITTKLGMAPLEQKLLSLRGRIVNASAIPVYPDGLTGREVEVLRLIAAGKSNREIAKDLVITENTGTKHVANILAKTASSNRVEAANYARAQGLLK
jgi:DNA-binding CsgD family transcriptional regulator